MTLSAVYKQLKAVEEWVKEDLLPSIEEHKFKNCSQGKKNQTMCR